MSTQEKMRFLSPQFENQNVRVREGMKQAYTDPITGKQFYREDPDLFIKFKRGIYETDDPDMITLIKNCPDFTGSTHTGHAIRKTIFEAARPDPNAVALHRMIQSMPVAEALARLQGHTPGQQPTSQVQDPVAATAQQMQAQQQVVPIQQHRPQPQHQYAQAGIQVTQPQQNQLQQPQAV